MGLKVNEGKAYHSFSFANTQNTEAQFFIFWYSIRDFSQIYVVCIYTFVTSYISKGVAIAQSV
jgi:hypothetical protein